MARRRGAQVETRHERACRTRSGGSRCNCTPSYRDKVYDPTKGYAVGGEWTPNYDEAAGRAADKRRGLASPKRTTKRGGMTASEFHALFIAAARSGVALAKGHKRYSVRTLDVYERDFRVHVEPLAGDRLLDDMDAVEWSRVFETIAQSARQDGHARKAGATAAPLSAATVQSVLAAVRAGYRWGSDPLRDGGAIVDRNAIRDVTVRKAPAIKRRRAAAPETVPTLLAALKSERVRILWALMFYAGLRVGEARALDWSDVDLRSAEPELIVPESKTYNGRERRIPLVAPLVAILREWRGDELRVGPIVPGTKTLRFPERTVSNHAQRRWSLSGLERYMPHEARHTYASILVAHGIDIAELRELLGHASIRETAEYVHTLPGYRQAGRHARISAAFDSMRN